jgi:hypothetical protein
MGLLYLYNVINRIGLIKLKEGVSFVVAVGVCCNCAFECLNLVRVDVRRNWIRLFFKWGHMVAQWLRRCATNQKVMGSIPDGFFF